MSANSDKVNYETGVKSQIRAAMPENFDEYTFPSRGVAGFPEVEPTLETIRSKFLRLETLDLSPLSMADLRLLQQTSTQFIGYLQPLKNFNFNQDQVDTKRAQELGAVQTKVEELESTLNLLMSVALTLSDNSQAEAQRAIDKLKKDLEQNLTQSANFLVEIETARDAALAATGVAGAAVHSGDFKELADGYEKRSHWLLALSFCFVLGLAICIVLTKPKTDSAGLTFPDYLSNNAQYLGWALFAAFGAIVFIRLFASERHNMVVNRHRETALKTFRAFVEGSDTQSVKDAVLLQAATCIFTVQPSGYSKAPIDLQQIPFGVLGHAAKPDAD